MPSAANPVPTRSFAARPQPVPVSIVFAPSKTFAVFVLSCLMCLVIPILALVVIGTGTTWIFAIPGAVCIGVKIIDRIERRRRR